jgi:hypothetical protein
MMLLAPLPLTAQADQTTEARTLASQMIQQPGAALKQQLAANGRAIGYELGQVRGAVTIKQPIGTDQ